MTLRVKKKKKKRYAYLVTENLGNFQRIQEGGIVVLTHIAWAAITTFVYSGFPRTFSLERGIAVPRFLHSITSLWQLEDIKHRKKQMKHSNPLTFH